jgi:F-type H+-transporting ATPase subunit b
MLEFDWATLVFQIVNFAILLVLLNRFLFKPLRAKLDERRAVIAESLSSAREQEAEAARQRAEWEERMRMVEQQKEDTLRAAELEAANRRAELLQEARARLDQLTEEMRTDLRRERNEIIVRQYDEVLDTIIALAGNVVQSVTTRRTHDDLVTNFCASIYQFPQTDVQEYRRLMTGRVPTASVTTPVALTSEQVNTVTDTLSSLIDRRLELNTSVNPDLIAGIQVRLADKLMDNTVRQRLDLTRERVRADLMVRMGADS